MSVTKIIAQGLTPASFVNGATYQMSVQVRLNEINPEIDNLIKMWVAPEGVAFVDLDEAVIIDSNTPLGVVKTITAKWTADVTASLKVALYAETTDTNVLIEGVGDEFRIDTPTVLVFPKANELRVIEVNNPTLNQKDIDNIKFKKWGNGYVCQPEYLNKVEKAHVITTQYKTDSNADHVSGIYNYGTGVLVGSLQNSILVSSLGGAFRYESRLNTSALAVGGIYFIKYSGTQSGEILYEAESEPFKVIEPGTRKTINIEYHSDKLAHDIDYTSGLVHKLTVDGKFDKLADTNEQEPFTDSAGTLDKINDITTLKRVLQVFNLPSYVIQKINIALGSDYCTINGVEVKGQDKLPMNFNKYYYSEVAETNVPLQDSQLRNLHV